MSNQCVNSQFVYSGFFTPPPSLSLSLSLSLSALPPTAAGWVKEENNIKIHACLNNQPMERYFYQTTDVAVN